MKKALPVSAVLILATLYFAGNRKVAITAEAAESLPPPDEGHPSFKPNLKTGCLSRLFGRGWRKQ